MPLKSGKPFLRIHYTGVCLGGQAELWLGLSVQWMCSGVLWKHQGSWKLLPFLIEALNHQSWELKLFHTIYGICASGRNWSVFITLVCCCGNTDWEQMFVWRKSSSRVFFYCHTWNPQQPCKSNSWKILIVPPPWKKKPHVIGVTLCIWGVTCDGLCSRQWPC